MVSDWTRSGPRNSEAWRPGAYGRPSGAITACGDLSKTIQPVAVGPGAEQVIRCLTVLQAAGAKVSIDDFGTLYFFHEGWRDGAFAFTTFSVALIATWVIAAHLSRSGT